MVFHVTPPPEPSGPETARLTEWLYRLAEYLNVYMNSGEAAAGPSRGDGATDGKGE
ncbi:MAG: hypothetical protein IKH56_06180 [Oscillospiraceae bacterium]|nr:hypothetical protein [Oscillospiraceae bacterium]